MNDSTIVILFVVGLALFAAIMVLPMSEQYHSMSTPIQSISDTALIHGRFSLGSGYIDSEPVFLYYEGTNETGFKLKHASASKSTIYRTDNESPRIVTTLLTRSNVLGFPITTPSIDSYTFYVPSSAIVNDFKLDSEV